MKRLFVFVVVVILFSALVDIPHIVELSPVEAAEALAVAGAAQTADPSLPELLNWSELANTMSTSVVLLALVWLLWRRHITQQEIIEERAKAAEDRYDQLVMLMFQFTLGRPVPPLEKRTSMEEWLTSPRPFEQPGAGVGS